ncbi:carboxypeptidase regulatory-like domain-containing protein [uncultured Lutibacter sp.]|uniref:TonB-dependent receptor n=1 Tax=uncultured Lutibacter sp. TaxID=437739 RepID=UPI0026276214|nr:carboxypeptidase regulatory-like domain-containing protein [uncultured Lutibacter sp.]
MKNFIKIFTSAVFILITQCIFSQGITSSSINGRILEGDQPLPGANIVALHVPSGTKYGSTTDIDGLFRISNMRVGGPYTIKITYVGYKEIIKENIYLQLGQTFRIDTSMIQDVSALDEIVINARTNTIFDGNRTGTETTIDARQIKSLPTTSRSIADFVRITPQATISEGSDGFSINIAGQNNRFNTIFVDGAVNNDQFGLSASGTNGGQTGASPFSMDAIEQFNVAVAPFDVKLSGFTGGAINAITKSGSNTFKGTIYGFTRNEKLVGKTPVDLVTNGKRESIAKFSSKTYGLSLGGPIQKDKLFFFVNYEREENETPNFFSLDSYIGNSTASDLSTLRNDLISRFGYDPGSPNSGTTFLDNDKVTLKMDYNVSKNHKLSLSYRYTGIENLEANTTDYNSINFSNGAESFSSFTNSANLEWNWQIGNKASNNLILGYTKVDDDRDPSGNPFPAVQIQDGSGNIQFGGEQYSGANILEQKVFTITDNFEIYKGAHTITIGTHNEFSSSKNLFFANNYGFYRFSNINDFLTDALPNQYQRGYSLLSEGVGDNSSGAAEFDLAQYGLYFQDEYQASNNLKLSFGIRFDMPVWKDGLLNDDFNNRTIPILEAAGKDLQGAKAGAGISSTIHLSPRLGFNWNVNGEYKTQVRGGIGVFTSRMPNVWPGAVYNNNGITGGYLFDSSPDFLFNPDINNQPVGVAPGSGGTGGNIDLFASDLKLPQIMKFNLGIDKKLPWWGLILNADFIYQDNIQTLYYENLNIDEPVGNLIGADNRPYYSDSFNDLIDNTYGRIILGSNSKEGYSWNASIGLTKSYSNGFTGNLTYTYGDARGIFDLTSSQNSSQWRNLQTVNGKNSKLPVTRSDFAAGHKIASWMSYEFKWLKDDLKTALSFYYEGREGTPFSYTYNDGPDLLNDDSSDNALIYVPKDQSEITLQDGANGLTAQEQWNALDAFIESNKYLKSRRGNYVERNGDRGNSWSHVVDFKLIQDINICNCNENKSLQFTMDIFNLTNLLNKNWGLRKYVPNFGEIELLNTVTAAPNPVFNFNPAVLDNLEQIDDQGIQSSRWQIRVGLRYSFN